MLEQHTDIFQEFTLLLPLPGKEALGARGEDSVVLGTSLIHNLLTKPPPLPQRFADWTWFSIGLTTILANCKSAVTPPHTYNALQGQTPSLTQ